MTSNAFLSSTVTPITASVGVTVTASATPHAKGAWVDLITAAANTRGGDLLSLLFSDTFITATDTSVAVDLAIGDAGSEVVIVEGVLAGYAATQAGASTGGGGRTNMFACYVPPGVRIAARCQSLIVSDTVVVTAHLMGGSPWGDPNLARGKWETYGFNATTTKGVAPVAGSANVKGSWLEVVASTTRDHRRFWVSAHGLDAIIVAGSIFLDVGVGAAASEIVIVPDIGFSVTSIEAVSGPFPPYLPLLRPVPAGSRIAVRTQSAVAGFPDLSVVVHAF